MIRLDRVHKAFGQVLAVSDVTLAIERHTAVSLTGPSGSGKTTLLRLIAGLEEPDTGEISLDGQIVSRPGAVTAPHTRSIGMVFQHPALWPHLTVARHIAFGLARWEREQIKARLETMARLVRLQGLAGRYPHQLSGGEAQRVALARALAPRPRILLLDEPLSNLDPELHTDMLELIRKVRAETGVTMIFVSHDPQTAAATCDRVVVIRGGRIVHIGPPRTAAQPSEMGESSPRSGTPGTESQPC